jgi:hypothetical protein
MSNRHGRKFFRFAQAVDCENVLHYLKKMYLTIILSIKLRIIIDLFYTIDLEKFFFISMSQFSLNLYFDCKVILSTAI